MPSRADINVWMLMVPVKLPVPVFIFTEQLARGLNIR